jgi:hypothetical protein
LHRLGKTAEISSCTSTVANHFVTFLRGKVSASELTPDQIEKDLGVASYKDLIHDIPVGRRPLRLEYLCIAKDLYNYSVGSAFGETGFTINSIVEGSEQYGDVFNKSLVKHISDKVHGWFTKHKLQKKSYAEGRLEKSRQALYANLSGSHRLYADELITIAQDLGESLDDLRSVPLPKGHILVQLQLQQQIIEQQQQQIELLKAKSTKK